MYIWYPSSEEKQQWKWKNWKETQQQHIKIHPKSYIMLPPHCCPTLSLIGPEYIQHIWNKILYFYLLFITVLLARMLLCHWCYVGKAGYICNSVLIWIHFGAFPQILYPEWLLFNILLYLVTSATQKSQVFLFIRAGIMKVCHLINFNSLSGSLGIMDIGWSATNNFCLFWLQGFWWK